MMMAFKFNVCVVVTLMVLGLAQPAYAQQRNASFVNPGATSTKIDNKNSQANTLVAEPASVDAGETILNIARRVTIFFYNGFRAPVQINELSLNADGNVRSRIVSDDCKTVKTLPVGDKCAIALEITPTSNGPWTVELLLNHNGSGRIARAEINGSTLGKTEEKSEGLSISKKIAVPLDFGDVQANEEKASRTMLIENDSTLPLVISSIDLISSRQDGLSIRSNGCKEGDELKSSESCPITVLWEPTMRGKIATDLIVRHSGNLGFVVVPIRGSGTKERDDSKINLADSGSTSGVGKFINPVSTSASLMPRLPDGSAQPISSMPALDSLPIENLSPVVSKRKSPPDARKMVEDTKEEVEEVKIPKILLVGTIGKRAILGDTQEQTFMVNLGEKVSISGSDVELLQLDATRAVVMISGKRINLSLRNLQTVASQGSMSDDSGDGRSSKSDTPLPVPGLPGAGAPPSNIAPQTNNSSIPVDPTAGTKSIANNSNPTGSSAMTSQDVLNMMK